MPKRTTFCLRVSAMRIRHAIPALAVTATAFSVACTHAAPVKPAPPAVYVSPVIQKDVPEYLDLVGQTQGFQDVDIRARVEGFLDTVNFREGSFVRKGDLLYVIDPKPLQASLAKAQGDLAAAKARLEKTNNDVARYTPLAAQRAVSQQELDNARAAQDGAASQVAAAAAVVDKARLDLGYTRVTSPINGLVGTTQVKPGNLVGHGDATLLTTISQIDPIIFRVAVAEADYLRIARTEVAERNRARSAGGIELALADGTVHPYPGRLGPVEREVNAATGTLGVQILFPNPGFILRPGQYGRARILLDMKEGALLVPQRAVREVQGLYSVAVVNGDKVTFRNVTVGQRVGTLWVIDKGITRDDHIVAEGLQAITDGMTVVAKAMPESSPAEQPVATHGGTR
jgi:membrane fusion protein (multidrug efflux system)